MIIKIKNPIDMANLSKVFDRNKSIWLETDEKCPICNSNLVVKVRLNGLIGFFHNSSGIILACENWGKCESHWNRVGHGREYPWHTWISKYHKGLDISRGNYGNTFLIKLKDEFSEIFNKLIKIDYKINMETKETMQ